MTRWADVPPPTIAEVEPDLDAEEAADDGVVMPPTAEPMGAPDAD